MDFNYTAAHQDYLAICKMNCSRTAKRRMLDTIIFEWSGYWRVLGITQAALEEFAQYGYKRVPGMNINRSHVMDRKDRNDYLLDNVIMDPEAWWNYIVQNDTTYFATKTENMTGDWSTIIEFTNQPEGSFQATGFAWRHRKAVEALYLQQLHAVNL